MKYFLRLSYHGGRYHGWQRQNNVISVQQVLEEQLSKLLKEEIVFVGCGRTDAGVHASQYYGHIKTNARPNKEFLFRINKILPADIAIHEIFPVVRTAHAQHDARWRTYDYFIHGNKNPLINQTSTEINFINFDITKMKEALDFLLEVKDFKSLCKNPAIYKTTLCTIREVNLIENKPDHLQFRITANRFLRSMVRLIVSKLLKVGSRKLTIEEFKHHIQEGISFPHFDPVPPQGLHLSKVEYEFDKIRNDS